MIGRTSFCTPSLKYSFKEQNIPVNMCPKASKCWGMCYFRVMSTADAVCGLHSCNTTFTSSSQRSAYSFRNYLDLLEYPDRHYVLVAVTPRSHWSALNTPKPLSVLTAESAEDLEGKLTGPPCPIHFRPNVRFSCWQCEENEVLPHHALITRVVVDEEAHRKHFW